MSEKPILFNAAMVRAVLDGTKTVTRRIVNPQPPEGYISRGLIVESLDSKRVGKWEWESVPYRATHRARPPCLGGDQLWVRETWQAVYFDREPDYGNAVVDWHAAKSIPTDDNYGFWTPVYAADGETSWVPAAHGFAAEDQKDRGFPWRPGIHMPRWASRIQLDVVSVRPERLWDITDEDAAREGITVPSDALCLCPCEDAEVEDPGPHHPHCDWRHPDLDGDDTAREVIEFACLWDSINKLRAPWKDNPWVWRVEFRRAS